MTNARLLMRREFTPDHAQLEFGDIDGEYPQWEFGAEPLVANEHKIVVATPPELEGDAVIEVWAGADKQVPQDAGVLIHDGFIRLSGDDAEVGTYLGGRLERVRVGRGRHRVRVFVDEPGYATRIVYIVTPAESS
jgi:hypothetical protein